MNRRISCWYRQKLIYNQGIFKFDDEFFAFENSPNLENDPENPNPTKYDPSKPLINLVQIGEGDENSNSESGNDEGNSYSTPPSYSTESEDSDSSSKSSFEKTVKSIEDKSSPRNILSIPGSLKQDQNSVSKDDRRTLDLRFGTDESPYSNFNKTGGGESGISSATGGDVMSHRNTEGDGTSFGGKRLRSAASKRKVHNKSRRSGRGT